MNKNQRLNIKKMKKNIISNALFVASTIVFNAIFWGEKMGINTLLFTIFMIPAIFTMNPKSKESKAAIASSVATLLTATFVVIHNSMLSKGIHILSFFIMIAFVQQRQLKFIGYALALSIVSFFRVPYKFIKEIDQFRTNSPLSTFHIRRFKLAILPLIIVPGFYGLYYVANPKFAQLANGFWNVVGQQMSFDVSFQRVLMFVLGFFVSGAALLKTNTKFFITKEGTHSEKLRRVKNGKLNRVIIRSILALKNEYKSGVVLIFCLNALLAIVNAIDLKFVWLNYESASPSELSTFVHEGTYCLIAAVMAAMALTCYFFRKNINFLPDNKLLKTAMYFWVGQNAVMTISVAIRNYRYIDYYGLAYNRIGVMVFLALTMFGLFTMVMKVKDKRSNYFLLHRNAWAIYMTLVLSTAVNWDIFITRYNIEADIRNQTIDAYFLYNEMTTKNLYLLHEHDATLKSSSQLAQKWFQVAFENKKKIFLKEQDGRSWLSWNMADARNSLFLTDYKAKVGLIKKEKIIQPKQTEFLDEEQVVEEEILEEEVVEEELIIDEPVPEKYRKVSR